MPLMQSQYSPLSGLLPVPVRKVEYSRTVAVGLRAAFGSRRYLRLTLNTALPRNTRLGEQLLDVRRDKRERAAFAAMGDHATKDEEEEVGDERDRDMGGRYRVEMAELGGAEGERDA